MKSAVKVTTVQNCSPVLFIEVEKETVHEIDQIPIEKGE